MARLVRWLDIAIFLGFTAYVLVTAPRESNWYAGLAVAAVCTHFWVAARRQLGASFSVGPDARREEAVLAETFGSQYIAYRERTWF